MECLVDGGGRLPVVDNGGAQNAIKTAGLRAAFCRIAAQAEVTKEIISDEYGTYFLWNQYFAVLSRQCSGGLFLRGISMHFLGGALHAILEGSEYAPQEPWPNHFANLARLEAERQPTPEEIRRREEERRRAEIDDAARVQVALESHDRILRRIAEDAARFEEECDARRKRVRLQAQKSAAERTKERLRRSAIEHQERMAERPVRRNAFWELMESLDVEATAGDKALEAKQVQAPDHHPDRRPSILRRLFGKRHVSTNTMQTQPISSQEPPVDEDTHSPG